MTPEHEIATQPTVRTATVGQPMTPVPGGAPVEEPEPADPLAKVTLRPRTYGAVLAAVGLVLGLLLAILPVHVAGLDASQQTSVSCGNTIGGVETPLVGADLGDVDPTVLATYVGTCQDAISTRLMFSWPMFFAGMLAILWLGVVRRPLSVE
ncbi:MAG: hypothetical protein GEV28_14390 [Actinophytocola sp.]|uniref:hypothetical protein n=1 Tax=Actinophytocola sp. TaxID=1872138 RepID=UPI00132ADDA1|nr:hypothetical protein [Actinophytocola sp.]MPZ81518.1 hypothetical protein [Actinophytocola sp.]